eukprot:GEMP01086688.1.p1 GENE.GEMP01086688.1~~GEMP01086688.1.p1  ORF type:complete len:105 (-),score=6.11 GEMP01086688.1:366-680(-)
MLERDKERFSPLRINKEKTNDVVIMLERDKERFSPLRINKEKTNDVVIMLERDKERFSPLRINKEKNKLGGSLKTVEWKNFTNSEACVCYRAHHLSHVAAENKM